MQVAPGIADTLRADGLLDRFGPFSSRPHLAVALSGGADSMALALLADEWARNHHGRITTLTVDHGLRAESRAEALKVAGWMHTKGIAHHILLPPHANDSNNLQENARMRRYDALADWCRANDVLHCLLAHHAGDQRETAALMQNRGDTADGAAGMPAVRNYRGVRFIRPLLDLEKEELKNYMRAHAMVWVEDPTNENTAFARVRVRQQLQSDRALAKHLSHQLHEAAIARNTRDQSLAYAAARCVRIHPLGFADITHAEWCTLEPTLASQLIADSLTTISGAIRRPREHETLRLSDALRTGDFKRATLHGCDITFGNGTIRIARELARCAPPQILSGIGTKEWDERFRIHYSLPQPLTLKALGANREGLPQATPSFWHLDEPVHVPHMLGELPDGTALELGFAPAKPLAPAPFWWLN